MSIALVMNIQRTICIKCVILPELDLLLLLGLAAVGMSDLYMKYGWRQMQEGNGRYEFIDCSKHEVGQH